MDRHEHRLSGNSRPASVHSQSPPLTMLSRYGPECYAYNYASFESRNLQYIDLYSCFEKGCPTKLYAIMLKGIMGNRGLWSLIQALDVSAT